MRNRKFMMVVIFLAVITMACGMFSSVSNLIGSSKSAAVSDLWPDVPRIDGLNKASMDLPLAAKLAIQGIVKTTSNGEGSLDFISFTTRKTMQDLVGFYSIDRMKSAGWGPLDSNGCQNGSTQTDQSGGMVCLFTKEGSDNKGTALIIFAFEDLKTKENQIFFARMDLSNLPTQTN
jgi:hypothetical protein